MLITMTIGHTFRVVDPGAISTAFWLGFCRMMERTEISDDEYGAAFVGLAGVSSTTLFRLKRECDRFLDEAELDVARRFGRVEWTWNDDHKVRMIDVLPREAA